MKTYRELLKEGIASLEQEGVEEARADAERLLMDLLGESLSFLFLQSVRMFEPPLLIHG